MGIRTRRARRHSKTHAVGFGIAGFFGFMALLMVAFAASLGALVSSWLQDLPDYTSADAYLVAEPTTVYAQDGTVIAEYYLQNRRSVDLDQISPYVLKGTVDVEDERFYQHNGVDPQGILRAIVSQISGRSEGASTITQQLVRNTVLSDEQFEQSLKRKVREAYIAVQMEKMYSKDQILNMYLNTIYYGHGAYGIEAASITYFNKDASDLTLAEAATLIGIPNSPSNYDPTVNMEACLSRRNKVLDNMLRLGDITQEEHDAAQAEPITLNLGSFSENTGKYPYFTDYVKQLLLQDFTTDTIMKGGLKVYTTLNPSMQEDAEAAVSEQLANSGNDSLQASLVAIDPSNGYVVAMVGGRDYSVSQYNLATQASRQPGSSFKAFTLITALKEGMSPNVIVNANSPMEFDNGAYPVSNDEGISYGNITLARAFAISSNTAFVQIAQTLGVANVAQTATDLGIDVSLPTYTSLTLGTTGVPVIQMAEAYATIASGGIHHDSIAITKIEDRNGNSVYEHKDDSQQVVSTAITQEATKVMQGVVKSGGTASIVASTLNVDQPVAGKTGTTTNFKDLWFVGITPQLSVAVWTGNLDNSPVRVNGAYGHPYSTSVPIFVKFVNKALNGVARAEFPSTEETISYKDNSSWTFEYTNSYANSYSYTTEETTTTTNTTTSPTTTTTTTTENRTNENTGETSDTTTTGTGGTGGTGGSGGGGGTTTGGGGQASGGTDGSTPGSGTTEGGQ